MMTGSLAPPASRRQLPDGVLECACPLDARIWIADLRACSSATGPRAHPAPEAVAGDPAAAVRPAPADPAAVARQVLAAHVGLPVTDLVLSADEGGRPRLTAAEGAREDEHHLDLPEISLARSGQLLLIAAAASRIGVDLEAEAGAQTVADVTTLLHPREQQAIAAAGAEERCGVFTQIWTRKEALLKAFGTGLARDLSSDDLSSPLPPAAGIVIADLTLPDLPPLPNGPDLPAMPAHRQRLWAAVCLQEPLARTDRWRLSSR